MENPLATSTENPKAPSFDLYGVTEKSTIQDVVDKLGNPLRIGSEWSAVHLATMRYELSTDEEIWVVNIIVDTVNNNIYKIEIFTV